MPDKLTPEQRHRCMASIRSKDTKPEVIGKALSDGGRSDEDGGGK